MNAVIWGCRGTLPAPGPTTVRYGGNTTCVAVQTAEGRLVVLDCGSGMRPLGVALADWSQCWFPDAFVGTMAQLLCAVEEDTEPEIGGRDNVETIALCEAVFAAARDHRVTTVREFLEL